MNQQEVFRNCLAALLLLLPIFGCSKRQSVFNDPHFYYDEENYTLIRVNPKTRKEDIKKYHEQNKKTMFKYTPPKPKSDTAINYDLPPHPRTIIPPVYPQELKQLGYSGKVNLKLLINEKGLVIRAEPAKGGQKLDRIGILLIKASLESAIQTEFFPAMQGEKPVKVWVAYPIKYVLTTY